MWRAINLACVAALSIAVTSAPVHDFKKSEDLASFITRPDLRPPKFKINVEDPDSVTPGYWFVAPYLDLKSRPPSRAYQPDTIGPAIFDGQGNLVWSGADLFEDRIAFDFRPKTVNGTQFLSLILNHDSSRSDIVPGAGVILNSAYEVVENVFTERGNGLMNMHEFKILDDGNTALTINFESVFHDFSREGKGPWAWIGNTGFQEVDVRTGDVIFQWFSLDHVSPTESVYKMGPAIPGKPNAGYDFFHLNSVDKNADGDYLISARYTNTIYKISGRDGSILWRLGGPKSSFKQLGFNFSAQHDARFRKQTGDTTEISFLNNAANSQEQTSNTSSVMIVSLNHKTHEATLVRNLERPDGKLSRLRGNAQELPNGNYFVCWSENNYISEFDPEGRLVLDAQFSSHRLVNYRAYKFNFTGYPTKKPHAKAHVYGVNKSSSTTAVYMSWNGATEVKEWKFYGSQNGDNFEDFTPLGTAAKDGFETEFMATGYMAYVYAEAIAADGEVLGRSHRIETQVPKKWKPSEKDKKKDDSKKESEDTLVKNPQQNRREDGAEEEDRSPLKSVSNLTSGFMSEGVALLLISCALIISLILLCHLRRRKAWYEA